MNEFHQISLRGVSNHFPGNESSLMSQEVLRRLSIYEKAGIVSRENLADVPEEFQPRNIMPDFKSIIVLARVPKDVDWENRAGKFHYDIGVISAQDEVIKYLHARGYKTQIIGSRSKQLSLPRLAERAGVGQLSPFSTLAVKGYGLRSVLSAIITDAPLQSSPSVTDACNRRDTCLKRCPALGANGLFDRKKCTSCGACVKKCPVS